MLQKLPRPHETVFKSFLPVARIHVNAHFSFFTDFIFLLVRSHVASVWTIWEVNFQFIAFNIIAEKFIIAVLQLNFALRVTTDSERYIHPLLYIHGVQI